MPPTTTIPDGSRPRPARGAVAPLPLVVIAALFLLVIGYLVAGSLVRRSLPSFEPGSGRIAPGDGSLLRDTVTIDASDVTAWRFFDFTSGRTLAPPDTAGWDLAFRRFSVVPAAGAIDLGNQAFEDVIEAPATGYVTTTFARDTVNAATDRWYEYNMFSHRLEPDGHVYVIETPQARYAKLEFLSYYCTGMRAGCVTFRYAYQTDTTRHLR